MSDDDKHIWIAILRAAGVAEAAKEPLDVARLAAELDVSEQTVQCEIEQLEFAGLVLTGQPGEWPILLTAGRQFLTVEGRVPWDVLHFLPRVIDDLHAREALLHGGIVLVDEFRYQHLHGDAVEHAKQLVP